MKFVERLIIKYTVYLALCLFANFYILVLSPLNIPAYVPYTQLKINGLMLFIIFTTALYLFIKELISVRPELTIAQLTFFGTMICFFSEAIFQIYSWHLFPDDGFHILLSGVVTISIFFGVIAFFIAFQLKTGRTKRLILFITVTLGFVKFLTLISPTLFCASQMKPRYLFILFFATLASCKNGKSPSRLKYTIAKDSNLYIQIYRTGLFETSTTAYLTDSVNFSQKLGTYDDEKAYIDCKLKGDIIVTETKEYLYDASPQPDTMKVASIKTYSLKALKQMRNFK